MTTQTQLCQGNLIQLKPPRRWGRALTFTQGLPTGDHFHSPICLTHFPQLTVFRVSAKIGQRSKSSMIIESAKHEDCKKEKETHYFFMQVQLNLLDSAPFFIYVVSKCVIEKRKNLAFLLSKICNIPHASLTRKCVNNRFLFLTPPSCEIAAISLLMILIIVQTMFHECIYVIIQV